MDLMGFWKLKEVMLRLYPLLMSLEEELAKGD